MNTKKIQQRNMFLLDIFQVNLHDLLNHKILFLTRFCDLTHDPRNSLFYNSLCFAHSTSYETPSAINTFLCVDSV